MKISTRLRLESLIVLCIICGTLLVSILAVDGIRSSAQLFEDTVEGVAAAGDYERELLRLFSVTLDILLSEEGEIEQDRLLALRLSQARVHKAGRALGAVELLPRERAEVEESMQAFLAAIEQELIAPIYNRTPVDPDALHRMLYAEYEGLAADFAELQVRFDALSAGEARHIARQTGRTLVLLTILLATALLSSLLLTLFHRRGIILPLRKVLALVREMADGEADLSRRLPVTGRDEIGDLCANVNSFVGVIAEAVASLEIVSRETRATGSTLTARTHQTATELNAIEVRVREMSAVVTDLAPEVDDSSRAAGEILKEAGDIRERARDQIVRLNEAAEKTSRSSTSLARLNRTAAEKLEESRKLNRRSEEGARLAEELNDEIGRIHDATDVILETIGLITSVSDRTRILSMNAAIEAAHAGAAGRGFSVIAEEIRNLSETTGKETTVIVRELESIGGMLDRLRRESTESATLFRLLRDDAELFAASFSEFAREIGDAEAWSSSLVHEITAAAKTGEVFSGSADSMTRSAEDIDTITGRLRTGFSPLHAGIEEITGGTGEIRSAVAELEGLSRSNRDHIEEIDRALKRFSGGRPRR